MKKFLFLSAMLLSGIGASAQEEPADGTAYYLYNTETGKFLTRGASYGSQGIVESVGLPWNVTLGDATVKLQMLDIAHTGNTSGLGNNGFTDNGSPVFLSMSGSAEGYTLGLSVNSDNTLNMSGTSTWQFLTAAQYRQKLADKTAANQAEIASKAGESGDIASIVTNTNEWVAKDMTSKIPAVNNTNWNPTSVSNRRGDQNQGNYGVESYQTGDAKYSCAITGLTPGVYKVGVRALHRSVNNAANLAVGNAGYDCSSAYFEANGYRTAVKDWYSSHAGDNNPNSTGQFVTIANNGGYYTELFTYVGEDGVLNLKVAATSWWYDSWLLFNGCTLTYYTNSVSEEDAEAIIASIPTDKMDATVQSALDAAKTAFESAKTIANYNTLQSAIEEANASIATYAAAKKKADATKAKITAAQVDVAAAIAAFNTAYDTGNLKGEEDILATAYNAALEAKLNSCTNVTAKITNPSFENGVTGWTTVDGWKNENPYFHTNNSAQTFKDGQNFVEGWVPSGNHGDETLTQTITDLPQGEYILTVMAKNEQQANGNAATGMFVTIGTQKYEVNSAAGELCAVSFRTETKSDITIGFEVKDCTGNWIAGDNFKLYFNGIDTQILTEAITEANAQYASYDATKPYAIELKTAINNAETALNNGFATAAALQEAVTALTNAMSIAKVAARTEAYAQLADGRYVFSLDGKYLGAANSWGTQASLIAHPEYVTIAKLADGKYSIDSQVKNNETDHYFNGSFMDGSMTPIEIITAEGGYYLSNGTKYFVNKNGVVGESDTPATWTIKSIAEMDAMMEDATAENLVDITYKVADPNFGRNNIHAEEWIRTADVNRGGTNENQLYEAYCKAFSIYQTLTDLPTGYYVVKATAMYRQDGSDENLPYIFANDVKTTFALRTGTENNMNEAAASMAAGQYEVEARVLVEDGNLTLGAASEGTSCWAIFDNFQLYAAERVQRTPEIATISVEAKSFASFVGPFAIDLANAPFIKAYTVGGLDTDGETLLLNEVQFSTTPGTIANGIPAYTPVILENTNDTNWGIEIQGYVEEPASGVIIEDDIVQPTDNNWLAGVLAGEVNAPADSYVMQKHDELVAFWHVVPEIAQPLVSKGHCYLDVPAQTSGVKMFRLGTETTGIKLAQTASSQQVIYNLAGQRIQKAQRGINIINGKKVLK